MSTKYIERRHDAAKVATGSHAGVGVEYSTNKIYVKPSPDVDRLELVDTSTAQTLTNKTLADVTLGTATGALRTARVDFVEDATSTQMQALVPIPAGSIIQGIDFQNRAAWVTSANLITTGGWTVGAGWTESPDETFTHAFLGGTAALSHSATIVAGRYYSFAMDQVSGTTGALVIAFGGLTLNVDGNAGATTFTLSGIALNTTGLTITPATGYDGVLADAELIFGATLDIGDTADPDGYIANLLQNDDSVGLLSVVAEGNGAYTNGDGLIIGPTSSNFGFNYVAGSNIIATITNPVPSATAGRTTVVVYYTVPASFAPVLA